MGSVKIPALIFTILTFAAALVFIILGIVNWGKACGFEKISLLIGAIILICPFTCLIYILWSFDKSVINSEEKQKEIKKPLTKEEIAELEKIEMMYMNNIY